MRTRAYSETITGPPERYAFGARPEDDPQVPSIAHSSVVATIGIPCVTEGELEFAPCPPRIAHDPELRTAWSRQRHNVCHWLRQTEARDGLLYYRVLKPLLDAHAGQLAKAIDRNLSR
ncbi:hypothetical protein OOK36_53010 [Streptomyces sp. NBC_00365]|uniref:hypothetical protein n=1 Tax=Streptomyces sp. NBC_00365 TaxID=2975726 RepID=UPI00224E84C9|nr:hypothetical protein [Streptomyces sp. NBC_00365]MCX5097239.1 hypothetical protein [Streptomyces sp. NBC_00365]